MSNTDTWAFYGLILFFLCLGALLPYMQSAFNQDEIQQNFDGLPNSDDELSTDTPSMLNVFLSIVTVFFWTFGQINVFIDLIILTPLRILAVYLLVRMVRGI